jgi:hypothetical protein
MVRKWAVRVVGRIHSGADFGFADLWLWFASWYSCIGYNRRQDVNHKVRATFLLRTTSIWPSA